MAKKMKIALLTGGGDCPGLNAVIRAVAKTAILGYDADVLGIEDGYEGLIHNMHRRLDYRSVSGILAQGGTILGTSNKANPYKYITGSGKKRKIEDVSEKVKENLRKMGIDCLVCIGGDGTLTIANKLYKDGIPVVGIPKTIDNDITGTDISFGFNSAVRIATEGIDRLHTTAMSHHRIMIIEVMGRTAGWIALHSGVAGGGDVILMPEIPYNIGGVANYVRKRHSKGKRFSIIVIAEGARKKGGKVVVKRKVDDASVPVRLGGVGFVLAEELENMSGIDTRAVVMGHLIRGGSPTEFDRVLGTQLGSEAVRMIAKRQFGRMVAVKGGSFVSVPLSTVAKGARQVPLNHPLINAGKCVGTYFGQ
jgi:6-phosphofructokinase 1